MFTLLCFSTSQIQRLQSLWKDWFLVLKFSKTPIFFLAFYCFPFLKIIIILTVLFFWKIPPHIQPLIMIIELINLLLPWNSNLVFFVPYYRALVIFNTLLCSHLVYSWHSVLLFFTILLHSFKKITTSLPFAHLSSAWTLFTFSSFYNLCFVSIYLLVQVNNVKILIPYWILFFNIFKLFNEVSVSLLFIDTSQYII